jgi:hypothetical protein
VVDAVLTLLQRNWDDATAKTGKFVEAALKALATHAKAPIPPSRAFKADVYITQFGLLPAGTAADTVRLTIPRVCRFIYDIASNRGARHDPDEIDPNEMDATSALNTSGGSSPSCCGTRRRAATWRRPPRSWPGSCGGGIRSSRRSTAGSTSTCRRSVPGASRS